MEYMIVETFCNKLLNENEGRDLKEKLRCLESKVYTFPDGWSKITTTVVLETKLVKVKEVYEVLLSFGFYVGTIKYRRTSSNISFTVFDNKVEYMINHKYLQTPYEFKTKLKKILDGK